MTKRNYSNCKSPQKKKKQHNCRRICAQNTVPLSHTGNHKILCYSSNVWFLTFFFVHCIQKKKWAQVTLNYTFNGLHRTVWWYSTTEKKRFFYQATQYNTFRWISMIRRITDILTWVTWHSCLTARWRTVRYWFPDLFWSATRGITGHEPVTMTGGLSLSIALPLQKKVKSVVWKYCIFQTTEWQGEEVPTCQRKVSDLRTNTSPPSVTTIHLCLPNGLCVTEKAVFL